MSAKEDRLTSIENQLNDIAARLAALETAMTTRATSQMAVPPSPPSASGEVKAGYVEHLKAQLDRTEDPGEENGLVAYAGVVRSGDSALMWEFGRTVADLLDVDVEPLSQVLAALGSAVRLDLVRSLLRGPRSSQQLQEALGMDNLGPLYYHLKELMAAGIVSQPNRNTYQVVPQRIIPFLVVLAVALDLRGG